MGRDVFGLISGLFDIVAADFAEANIVPECLKTAAEKFSGSVSYG